MVTLKNTQKTEQKNKKKTKFNNHTEEKRERLFTFKRFIFETVLRVVLLDHFNRTDKLDKISL